MKSALLLAAVALGVSAQDLTINTPTQGTVIGAAECQPLLVSWSGGTPPYIITVDTSPAGAAHVAEFDAQTGTSLVWTVNATVGTQLLFGIEDNTGLGKTSAPFPVLTGSGDGCIGTGGTTGSNPGKSSSSSSIRQSTSPSALPGKSSTVSAAVGFSSSTDARPSGGSSTVATSSSTPLPNTRSPSSPTSLPSNPGPPAAATKKKKVAGPIAGGVIGGLIVLGALGFFLWRLRRTGQSRGGPAFAGGLDDVEKQPSAQPLPTTSSSTPQDAWSPEDLFTTLPSGETQLSSLPTQVVPRGILAGEEKARRTAADRMGFIQQEIRELQELADASSMSRPTVPHTNSSNIELLDEIRRLKEQMHAIEQRIQTQPSAEQATTEEPPEYTKT